MPTPVVTMKQLLEAGVHFGHQTRRWNPKMKRFIYGDRGGIYIIDLQQTLKRIETAYTYVRDTVADGGTIMFVGTKKQAQDPIQSYAEKCGMPYVNERWLGGMLTNYETISKRVAKMQDYRRMRDSGEFEAMPKKEALLIGRELEKLERNLGGIAKMEKLPNAIFVLDTKKEHIAVTEANKLGMPIVAVVDTNCDPDVIQYVIPGNDDAIRSGTLLCRVIADAVDEGRLMASKRGGPAPAPSRTADEEAMIASQQAAARRQAAQAAAEREARIAAARAGDASTDASTAAPSDAPEEGDVEGAADTEEALAEADVALAEADAALADAEAVLQAADGSGTEAGNVDAADIADALAEADAALAEADAALAAAEAENAAGAPAEPASTEQRPTDERPTEEPPTDG
jgi:small subunit ribosomal protein S2